MTLYFSTKQFNELNSYSFAERQQIVALASAKIKPLGKFVLNLLKLCLLIPAFLMLANIESWLFVLPLGFVLIGYFILLRPLSLYFMHQYLTAAIAQYEQQKT